MQNFSVLRWLRKRTGNRSGSQIVEATMVLPAAITIFACLIIFLIQFYAVFMEQTELHETQREELYQTREVPILRIRDRLSETAEGEASG